MRALIVLGGDAPDAALLAREKQKADFTIAADSGMDAFDAAGLEPDLLVGDMDSIDHVVLERYRGSEERLSCIKDDTDGVHALDVALKRGADEISILGALGGRLDHALGNLMLLVRAHERGAEAEILADGVRIVRVNGRETLCHAQGDTVSILPLGQAKGVTLTGLYYPLTDKTLESDYPLGISNVVTEEEAIIQVKDGDLILFHYMKK